jgi:hypothetical protein
LKIIFNKINEINARIDKIGDKSTRILNTLKELGLTPIEVDVDSIVTVKQLRAAEVKLEALFKDEITEQTRGKISLEMTKRLGEQILGDGGLTEQQFMELLPGTAFNAEKTSAAMVLLANAKKAKDVAAKAIVDAKREQGRASKELIARYVKASQQYHGIYQNIRGVASEAARSLGVFRNTLGSKANQVAQTSELVEAYGNNKAIEKSAIRYSPHGLAGT